MSSLPPWVPVLLENINWGCSTSPWFVDLACEDKVLERGRRIILDLWPFIKELPANIASVKQVLPAHMGAARKLLEQLVDDERHYQELFRQQFDLAGLVFKEVEVTPVGEATLNLCKVMERYCRHDVYVAGVHAIVAAELSATMYCRSSLPLFEKYFENTGDKYAPELIVRGLAWLRLHAQTHVRNAILMKRMLCDIQDTETNTMPEAAREVLRAVLYLWQCPSPRNHVLV